VSPPDAGVCISILLRPETMTAADLAPITLACGVAAAKAVERTAGIRLGLKWVNDLVYEGRKIGGILAEMPSTGANGNKRKALVIGFGLNVRLQESDVPADLRQKMGWLEQISGNPIDRNFLVAELLAEVERVYLELQSKHVDKLLAEWRSRSATLGKEIVATSGNNTITGTAVDIESTGALLVRCEDGTIHQIHAGEVSIRTSDGKYI
jgi:BirA family biotin operon repressor/biotin-[acetyl-CoA-carboxylase] ligase